MNNDILNLVNELNSTTPKTQMYMIQLCRSAINNLYDLTDTIEENISSLQNSVVANTSAISGLQGSIDVINANLNAYLGRIEALETKTSNMSKNGVDTRFSNSVNVEGSIFAGNSVNADGDISGAVLESNNDNGRGRFYIDGDGDMNLSMPNNAGKLITSGNISEYASDTKYYNHNIMLYIGSTSLPTAYTRIHIVNKQSTAMTQADLIAWFQNNGYGSRISTEGLYVSFGWTRLSIHHVICGIGTNGTNILCYYDNANDVLNGYINDDVVTEL